MKKIILFILLPLLLLAQDTRFNGWYYGASGLQLKLDINVLPYTTIAQNLGSTSLLWDTTYTNISRIISLNQPSALIETYGANIANGTALRFKAARGTYASPSAIQSGDYITGFSGFGYGTSAWSSTSRVGMFGIAAETWTNTAQGSYIAFATTLIGSTTYTERMRIADTGYLGIGSTSPERKVHAEISGSGVNNITSMLRLSRLSTGTVVAGFGTGIEFELEENDGTEKIAGIVECLWSDAGGGTNADGYFNFKTMLNDAAAASVMVVGYNGYVGVGTSSPGSPLEVVATGASSGIEISRAAYQDALMGIGNVGGSGDAALIFDANAYEFKIDGAAGKLVLLNTGNIGNGTATPYAQYSQVGTTPIAYWTDSDLNLSRTDLATAIDSASAVISASGTNPYFKLGGATGSVDQTIPTLLLRGDADTDASAVTTEALTLTLTGNATPTLATWGFTSTQGAGYTFDKSVSVSGNITQKVWSGSMTDTTPTDGEIDAITSSTPAGVGTGWNAIMIDSDGAGGVYRVISDGTNWYYIQLTQAL